ncbi:ComF family protein [Prosthecochloris sp. N3]|uniref:ComF family protein n=2 Tax=Prosthecochloris ethylica TaxID=2743976 RepID=A0ABR9XNX7_9CHLB|nr:ComF family protein [Prosthecochloris ethylica]MBF0585821.1 ComF family protein [Prosthecochloris ethylica]MBF0635731.1 ComF family protein [Prosthecochloris ethylica]NUK47029.1 ComF family protein [Prosthecochloris ethylica]
MMRARERFLRQALHLFYPDACVSCGTLLQYSEEMICSRCLQEFDAFSTVDASTAAVTKVFRAHHPSVSPPVRAAVLYRFHHHDRLQGVLHDMKYLGVYRIAWYFGRAIARYGAGAFSNDLPEMVMPVPLHPLRIAERTYNQSALIAQSLAGELGLPLCSDALIRRVYTSSQTGLTAAERHANLRGAFEVHGSALSGHVLLVDDVMTTGSTIAEAMSALRSSGVDRVSLAIVALAARSRT